MESPYEVEVKITSAKDLKSVNWRYGPLKPYAVVWVNPNAKCSTKVDEEGDTSPYWNEKLVVPLNSQIEDSTLYIDIVHANAEEDTKPLIGSAKIPLIEVVDDVGIGGELERTIQLKRPSGRPQGKVEVQVTVREPHYRARDAYYAPPYGVPPPSQPYNYGGGYGAPYSAPPPPPYGQGGYGQSAYGVGGYGQPATTSYGQPAYGEGSYGQPGVGYGYEEEKKKSKFGMGTGLAVGAVAGALGGLAIAEGIDHLEDKIADDAAEKVEEDLADDDGDYGGDDF